MSGADVAPDAGARGLRVSLVAAMDRNRAIGRDNALPWHLPDDLRRFKALEFSESRAMLAALREVSRLSPPDTVAGHWMDWNMIREMADNGMTIGGHTVNHPVLSRLPRDRQREEIEGCGARILAETGRPMEYFAYPVGNRWAFNDDTVACLEAAGVRRAFSYYGGEATPASPRFDTPRVAIEPHVGLPDLDAMLRLPRIFCGRDPE